MDILKHTIHYLYGTYCLYEINDLSTFAKFLVKKDFCKTIFHSNNQLIFKKDDEMFSENIKVEKNSYQTIANVEFSEALNTYDLIYLQQSIEDQVYKEHFFKNSYGYNVEYIKCFLDKFIAQDDQYIYHFYPVLTIYSTGVILIDLRLFSREDQNLISKEEYITKNVNLYSIVFDTIKIPYCSFLEDVIEKEDQSICLRDLVEDYSEEDISFLNIDLKSIFLKDTTYNLDLIKDYLILCLESMLMWRYNSSKNFIGNYWIGKPLIIIKKHELKTDDKEYLINSTLSRTLPLVNNLNLISRKNFRYFNDYELYMTEYISLFINIDVADKEIDAIESSIVTIEEECLHLYLLIKQEYETINYTNDLEVIYQHKQYINNLKRIISDRYSSIGEINTIIQDLLYKSYEIESDEKLIQQLIEDKQAKIIYDLNKKRSSFYNLLSIFFGIISSSPIYDNIISPLFIDQKSSSSEKIFFYILTLVLMCIFVIGARFVINKKK